MAFTPTQLPSGRWRSGFRCPVTSKRILRTFDYSYEAEAWAVGEEQRLRASLTPALDQPPAPVAPTAPGLTFAQHGADWMARQGHLESETWKDYARCVRVISATELGAVPMAQALPRDYQRWLTQQLEAGEGRPTINRRTKVLRMVWKDAIAHGVARIDPSYGVKLLTTAGKVDRTLSLEEEATLLTMAKDDHTRAMLLVGLDAGLRWQEIAGLSVANIKRDPKLGDYLEITQVVEAKSRTVRQYVKGARLGNRARMVPIRPRLMDALAPLVDGASDGSALLFTAHDGRPLDYRNWLRRTWNPMVRRAALAKPAPTPHDMRHTFGSRLAAAGVPRSEIQKLMGHADEETTARYIHAGEDGHRRDLLLAALATPAERKRARKAGRPLVSRHLAAVS